jgi:hypothetical protein
MTGVESGAAEWRGLFGHLVRWLGSLRRVGGQRTIESKLRAGELAGRWTELGFRLEDLGLSKLAGRCEITCTATTPTCSSRPASGSNASRRWRG